MLASKASTLPTRTTDDRMSVQRMELAKYARRSPALSVALLALDLCLYAAMVAGTIWAGDIWLKLVFAVGAGTMIALTSIVGHDAGHQSFSNDARLNRICGTLAFLPALHPFSLWVSILISHSILSSCCLVVMRRWGLGRGRGRGKTSSGMP